MNMSNRHIIEKLVRDVGDRVPKFRPGQRVRDSRYEGVVDTVHANLDTAIDARVIPRHWYAMQETPPKTPESGFWYGVVLEEGHVLLGEYDMEAIRVVALSEGNPDLEKGSPVRPEEEETYEQIATHVPPLGPNDRELPDSDPELDAVWDEPPFRDALAAVPELLDELKKNPEFSGGFLGGLPAALGLLVAASYICLDEGQDEFELLKAARAAFKKALSQRQGRGH